jgi:3,4-dihydroxy-2-butanone 4-phosphate synthase
VTWLGVDQAVLVVRDGGRIILVEEADDEVRGHLMIAAELATAAAMGWMIRHSFGIVCAAAPVSWLARLDLAPLPANGPRRPPYTVSVDATGAGTGISGADRALTLRVLSSPESGPANLARPGHVFPVAVEGSPDPRDVAGASLRLLALAGLAPVSAISQAMSDEASSPDLAALADFANRHGVGMLRVDELGRHLRLLDYRRRRVEPAWPHFGICEWDPDPVPAKRARRIA